MKQFSLFRKLQKLHGLIKGGHTGTPEELAARLDTSDRNLYLLIGRLKEYGAEIAYVHDLGYVYKNNFNLIIDIRAGEQGEEVDLL